VGRGLAMFVCINQGNSRVMKMKDLKILIKKTMIKNQNQEKIKINNLPKPHQTYQNKVKSVKYVIENSSPGMIIFIIRKKWTNNKKKYYKIKHLQSKKTKNTKKKSKN